MLLFLILLTRAPIAQNAMALFETSTTPISAARIQRTVRHIWLYTCVVVVQLLAPVGVLLSTAILMSTKYVGGE